MTAMTIAQRAVPLIRRANYYVYSNYGRNSVRFAVFGVVASVGLWKAMKVSVLSKWVCKYKYTADQLDMDRETDRGIMRLVQQERHRIMVSKSEAEEFVPSDLTLPHGLHIYYCNRLDAFTVGFNKFPTLFKSRIGVPLTFRYNSVEEIERALSNGELTINGRPVLIERNDLRSSLAKSMFLSEDAKRFVIHSELLNCASPWPHLLDAGFFLSMFSTAAVGSLLMNLNENIHKVGRRHRRIVGYTIIWALAGVGYLDIRDSQQAKYKFVMDKRVAEKDRLYLKGALELYSANLKRNLLLAELLPEAERNRLFRDKEGNVIREDTRLITNLARLQRLMALRTVLIEGENDDEDQM